MNRWITAFIGLVTPVFLWACGPFRPAPAPIPAIYNQQNVSEKADTLFIFLPGRYNGPEEFEKNGFVEAITEAGIRADTVCLDAHLGYYYRRTFLERLREDIVKPARKEGYRSIWLVGISMGGLGSILTLQLEPTLVDGVVAIAPFLGDKKLIEEIEKAGGVLSWTSSKPIGDDYQRQLWQWVKSDYQKFSEPPRLFLGYGEEDSLAPAHVLLASVLPREQVFTTRGEHTWEPWLNLFRQFLVSYAAEPES